MWVSVENEMFLTRRGCSWFPLLFPAAYNNVIAIYFWGHFVWSNAPATGSTLTLSEFFWPFIKRMLLTGPESQERMRKQWQNIRKGIPEHTLNLVIRLPAASKYTNKYLNSWSELVSLSHEHLFRYRNSIMHYRVHVGEVMSCLGGKVCLVRISSVDARHTVGFMPPMCHSCPQMIKEK